MNKVAPITRRVLLGAALAIPAIARAERRPFRIVITGDLGRVGSTISPYFIKAGMVVEGVDKKRGSHQDIGNPNADWVHRFKGAAAIIHLASDHGTGWNDVEALRYNNIDGTLNVLRAAKGIPIVFASSTHADPRYYNMPEGKDIAPHGGHPGPVNWYGLSKIVGEQAGRLHTPAFTTIRIGYLPSSEWFVADETPTGKFLARIYVTPEQIGRKFFDETTMLVATGWGYRQVECIGQ